MPLLAVFLGGLLTSLTTFFMTWVTKRLAVAAAIITMGTTITVAFWAALTLLVAGVSLALPSIEGVGFGLYLINSGALKAMVAVVLGIEIAATAYAWQRFHLRYLING